MIPLDRVKACSNPDCREVLPADLDNPRAAGFYIARRNGRNAATRYKDRCKRCQPQSHTHMVMRNGGAVLVKLCLGACGLEKVVSADKRVSEFYVRLRPLADGTMAPGWGPVCIECLNEQKRLAYAGLSREERRELHKAAWLSRKADPERLAVGRDAARTRRARFLGKLTSEGREQWLARHREAHRVWAERMREEDPDYFSRERRKERAALAAARRASEVSSIDGTRPELPAGPFTEWLAAYQLARGLGSAAELARELRLVERRVRSQLAGEQASVSVDVVSRALTEARVVVVAGGRMVVTLDDLYTGEKLRERRRKR